MLQYRVLADYETTGIWLRISNPKTGAGLSFDEQIWHPHYVWTHSPPNDLPDRLKLRFKDWCSKISKALGKDGFDSKFNYFEFNRQGLELALALQDYFGSKASVEYVPWRKGL